LKALPSKYLKSTNFQVNTCSPMSDWYQRHHTALCGISSYIYSTTNLYAHKKPCTGLIYLVFTFTYIHIVIHIIMHMYALAHNCKHAHICIANRHYAHIHIIMFISVCMYVWVWALLNDKTIIEATENKSTSSLSGFMYFADISIVIIQGCVSWEAYAHVYHL